MILCVAHTVWKREEIKDMIAGRERNDIPEAAYLIWEAEGRPDGRDMEHWLEAEKLISGAKRPAKAKVAKGADDLKKITGVGPVMAEKLVKAGITSTAQIAAFTDADIARVGSALKCKAKMLRDDWIGQAKKLSST